MDIRHAPTVRITARPVNILARDKNSTRWTCTEGLVDAWDGNVPSAAAVRLERLAAICAFNLNKGRIVSARENRDTMGRI
jgi:hypothetical protein